MSDVTVVTATNLRAERRKWLLAAHQSLHNNDAQFEHIIVLDGASADLLPAPLHTCPTVNIIHAKHYSATGAAAARTAGYFHAHTDWVTVLDDDDILPPASLDVRLNVAGGHNMWVGGHLQDLHGDVAGTRWKQPAEAGHYLPGDMVGLYTIRPDKFPYCGGTILMATRLVQALGGCGAVGVDEDIFLHLALTNTFVGHMLDNIVYMYRKHSGQWTREVGYKNSLDANRDLIVRRAEALHALLTHTEEQRLAAPRLEVLVAS